MKRFLVALVVVGVIGFLAGMIAQDTFLSTWTCAKGNVTVRTYDGDSGYAGWQGEQAICAKDWRITSVQGPELHSFEFDKWTPSIHFLN